MCCMRLAEDTGRKNSLSGHHRTILSGCIFATKACIDNREKTVKQQYLLQTNLQYSNFGPLTAENGSGVWHTPANFNGFRVLGSLLQRRRSPKANQSLHDVWPSPGLVHYIIFRGLMPLAEFWQVQKSCVLLYWQRYCTTFHQRPSAKLCGVVHGIELRNFRRGRHLYSAGRPSRWASAHILVTNYFYY